MDLFATMFIDKLHLCLTSSRPLGLSSRCPQSTLGGSGPICLPTSNHLGQSGGEIAGPSMQKGHTVAPGWAKMPWFWDLMTMSSQIPLCLPIPPGLHRNLKNLNLHAWPLETQLRRSRAFLREWQDELRLLKRINQISL